MRALSFLFTLVPTLTILLLIMGSCGLCIGTSPLLPASFLTAVFYWRLFSPRALPLLSLLIIGLFYDALLGHELGLSSALLVGTSLLGNKVRPSLLSHNFWVVWGSFALYSLGYIGLYALFLKGTLALLLSWGYAALLYPAVSWILAHLQSRLHVYV